MPIVKDGKERAKGGGENRWGDRRVREVENSSAW